MNSRNFIKASLLTIILLIIGFTNQSLLYYLPFIIIHELTHCFVGIMLGYSIKNIRMLPFGVSASFNEEFINPLDDILISASGPLINFIFFVIFSLTAHKNAVFPMLCQSNLILCIFNLLPAGFLDGGRILKNLLKIHVSFYSAYTINNINGIILGCLIAASSLLIQVSYKSIILILMGVYFIYIGYTSQKEIIINIVKDSLNKGVYLEKVKKLAEYSMTCKRDCKLLDVIKKLCYRKFYIIYIDADGKSAKILNESEILKAYLSFGNIMLSETGKLGT